jgi:hypothetical protein
MGEVTRTVMNSIKPLRKNDRFPGEVSWQLTEKRNLLLETLSIHWGSPRTSEYWRNRCRPYEIVLKKSFAIIKSKKVAFELIREDRLNF